MEVAELNVSFSSSSKVNISFNGADSGHLDFVNPLTKKDREDIKWYVETYGARSLADPDDSEARRIESRLSDIGKALFNAIFPNHAALTPFIAFRTANATRRVINIVSHDAMIQSLPWELLCESSSQGVYLFREKPRISIRRKIPGATAGRAPFTIEPKDRLHLLFVVSRPTGAGFIDPRADSQAVLDALESYAPGRVKCEFLRPATLNALAERLSDEKKPNVDILHFDGHGVYRQLSQDEADKLRAHGRRAIQSEIVRERRATSDGDAKGAGMGFLAFEDDDGGLDLVPANELKENLYQSRVGLVVLSACETASVDEEGDPMTSVAGQLTATGISAILAMTHSVLVPTTRRLFGEFYKSLAKGRPIGASLDDARAYVANNPEKYEVLRDGKRVPLKLEDWFVPALFHAGAESAMLKSDEVAAETTQTRHNLRERHEAGFFGRRHELWDIERWFAGPTRRISITGFGGQGKTELALEAGRWLLRTGMFRQAVFVDYAGVQSHDALAVAVSTISVVLEETFLNADAVTDALRRTPTLVILNNLETIAEESSAELLTAASAWSQAGESRVLLTSRRPKTGHPDYAAEGTFKHRSIKLEGLGSVAYPDDAFEWFERLMLLPAAEPPQIPPPNLRKAEERDQLVRLFDRVGFHPLSICVLVQQLRTRTARELEARLEQILATDAASLIADEGTPRTLVASLQLSLERLTPEQRHVVRRLGVFQRGAFESKIIAITALGADIGFISTIWPTLRRDLETAGLITSLSIQGVNPPYIQFHPTFALLLWTELEPSEKTALLSMHCEQYRLAAQDLYDQLRQFPHAARRIARLELSNILLAMQHSITSRDLMAPQFVIFVQQILESLGLRRELTSILAKCRDINAEPGSDSWYFTQVAQAEDLITAKSLSEAIDALQRTFIASVNRPTLDRVRLLFSLARCHKMMCRSDLAEQLLRESIDILSRSEGDQNGDVVAAGIFGELGEVLMNQGHYQEAAKYLVSAVHQYREQQDIHGQAIAATSLGVLELASGNTDQAASTFTLCLGLYTRLEDLSRIATTHRHLCRVYLREKKWGQAEEHCRQAAAFDQKCGNSAGLARTWQLLAVINYKVGKPAVAEEWCRKAIDALQKTDERGLESECLQLLATLVSRDAGRLPDAKRIAEKALDMKLAIHPHISAIWTTYDLLADISKSSSDFADATKYRRHARESIRKWGGEAIKKTKALPIAASMFRAIHEPEQADGMRRFLDELDSRGKKELADALRCILAGHRDEEAVFANLNSTDSLLIEGVLNGIENPSTLEPALMGWRQDWKAKIDQ